MTPTEQLVQAPTERLGVDWDVEGGAPLAELDDAALLSLARRGHDAAFGVLFDRYRHSAERFARHLGLRAEAGDVVSESFAQMFDLLSRGKGPEHAFRAYMFTTIRHEAGRRAKARQRVLPTNEVEHLDVAVPFGGGQLDRFEQEMIRDAFEALPQRWRSVLWAVDVEGRSPQEVAATHGMSANAVSALVYRARSGLRAAYLQQHINDDQDLASSGCGTTREAMVSVARGTAKQQVRERLFQHLEGCEHCDATFGDLSEVNGEIGVIGAPVAVAVAAVGMANWWFGMLGRLSAIKAQLVAAIIPAVAVGAVAIAPVVAPEAEPPNRGQSLAPVIVHTFPRGSDNPVRAGRHHNERNQSKNLSMNNTQATQLTTGASTIPTPPRSVPQRVSAAATTTVDALHLPQITGAVTSNNLPKTIVHVTSDALAAVLHGHH